MSHDDFLRKVAEAVDRRRLEITHIKRIVASAQGTVAENTACTMAIPMLYAHWEGFVQECCLEYVEFLETQDLLPPSANPAIFAFSLRKQLQRLTGEHTVSRITEFVKATLDMLSTPIRFIDKRISTKANLKFPVLQDLCDSLGISVERLNDKAKKINNLVEFRNNIAHGGRDGKNWTREDIDEYCVFVVQIMEDFEQALQHCLDNKAFLGAGDPMAAS